MKSRRATEGRGRPRSHKSVSPHEATSPAASTGPWRSILAGCLLVAMVIAAFSPALAAGFVWDDETYVTGNPTLRTVDGLHRMWFVPTSLPQYYPLVCTTFWLEYHLYGFRPFGYHLVNVLLHGLDAVLVWRLLRRLRVPGAWLAAAIFAVHPVCVESVAWVTERKNVVSLAFALLSMLAYLRFAPVEPTDGPAATAGRRWSFYALSLALFAAALLSKTAVVTVPAVLLVIVWWKRGRIGWADVWPLMPFFVLSVTLGLVTVWVEKYHVVARGHDWDRTPVERILVAGRVLWFYAGKLAWPHPIIFFYPRWSVDARAWWQYVFPIASIAVIAALWLARERIGRGPLAAVLIFAGVLTPVLGFFNVYFTRFSYVADHFQYHAAVALIALAAAAATTAVSRGAGILPAFAPKNRVKGGQDARPPLLSVVAVGAAAILLVALGALAFQQARTYRDLDTFYRTIVAKNPANWNARVNLGSLLDSQSRYDEAYEQFKTALAIKPDDSAVQGNMGHILLELGDRDGFQPGQLQAALAHYRKAVSLDPNDGEAQNGLGFALLRVNRPHDAKEHFAYASGLRPGFANPRYGSGTVLLGEGKWGEAIAQFDEALRLKPEYADAHQALALALAKKGELDRAADHLAEAIRLDPDFVEAHQTLGDLLRQQGKRRPAAKHYGEVVRLAPANVEALVALGTVLLELGEPDEAIVRFQEALRLRPDSAEAKSGLERARQLAARKGSE
ncbi:MAG: tetratricopeptide repeat protein [Planctomycetia bacterium]|nr:tetratricopeptide repeat protein [Planctomycetia bacterium]